MTHTDLAILLAEAENASPQRQTQIQVALCDAVPGMTPIRPITGPVWHRMHAIEHWYVAFLRKEITLRQAHGMLAYCFDMEKL